MAALLIAIIYLSFVSLGLPDSLLGSAWPTLHTDFGVPSSYAGYVSMAISFMTILSALLAPKLIKKLPTVDKTAEKALASAAAQKWKDEYIRGNISAQLYVKVAEALQK